MHLSLPIGAVHVSVAGKLSGGPTKFEPSDYPRPMPADPLASSALRLDTYLLDSTLTPFAPLCSLANHT